jgi:hypothetical protein
MPRLRASWTGLVFALLVLATLAAFAWSQRLKRDPLVLDRVTFVSRWQPARPGAKTITARAFTPNRDCRFDLERIRFRVTQSDHATVQVVKPGGKLVITLARNRYLKRYHFFTFHWDGRSRNDGIAPPGRYKLRVKLLGQERTLVPPGTMRLHQAKRNPTKTCVHGSAGGGS